jgi:hypothetical protein
MMGSKDPKRDLLQYINEELIAMPNEDSVKALEFEQEPPKQCLLERGAARGLRASEPLVIV